VVSVVNLEMGGMLLYTCEGSLISEITPDLNSIIDRTKVGIDPVFTYNIIDKII
jgi:hypothetical protein